MFLKFIFESTQSQISPALRIFHIDFLDLSPISLGRVHILKRDSISSSWLKGVVITIFIITFSAPCGGSFSTGQCS